MDGLTAKAFVNQLVRAAARTDIVQTKKTYDLLHMAAQEFVRITGCLTSYQEITTVADTASYDLEPNYLRQYLKTANPRGGEYFFKYTDSSSVNHFITFKAYQKVIYDDETTSVALPSSYTIHPKSTLPTRLTGTTTADGALSGGQATLTDAGESFTTTVNVGDVVHNTTSGKAYSGVVLSVTSDTALVTAMFDSNGDAVAWTSGDTWTIQPSRLMQLQFVPPPSTSSETGTFYYVAKPAPVYSDYGTWMFDEIYHPAICYKAAHVYLLGMLAQEVTPGFDVQLSTLYLAEWNKILHQARKEIDDSLGKKGYSMRLEK